MLPRICQRPGSMVSAVPFRPSRTVSVVSESVRVHGRVPGQVRDEGLGGALVEREVGPDECAHPCRDRGVDRHAAALPHDVELPAHPHERVPLLCQEAVAQVGVGRRIEAAARRAAEQGEHPLVATVRHFHQSDAVASGRVLWSEDVEVRGELHPAVGALRRLVEVHDDPVPGVGGVEGEVNRAHDLLVPGRADVGAPGDDADDLGVGAEGDTPEHHEGEQALLHAPEYMPAAGRGNVTKC